MRYNWTLVKSFPGGHRYWKADRPFYTKHHELWYAISDDSGTNPENTEDGIVWIDDRVKDGSKRLIKVVKDSPFESLRIPVLCANGDGWGESTTIASPTEAPWAAVEFGIPIHAGVNYSVYLA